MFKTFPAEMLSLVHGRRGRRNLRTLSSFVIALTGIITLYSVAFHLLMLREGQDHTWITGFYWTLTVMSTLGFGDITFHTDLGRLFSIIVLLSGTVFMLILLPFTFIEFFYAPWMSAQAAARAPRELPKTVRGHVLLIHYDAVAGALIRRLRQYRYPYCLIVPSLDEALRLHDLGINVLVGELDDPGTWERAQVQQAALVACTARDVTNTSVAFTVRGLTEHGGSEHGGSEQGGSEHGGSEQESREELPIVVSAKDEASVDILKLAGSSLVLRLEEMIGQAFARRVGVDATAHVIGEFDGLLIAEATAHNTPLMGKTLLENRLREKVGLTVIGTWERGHFEPARPETMIGPNTVLVLAGTKEHLDLYNELFCIYNVSIAPVIILGGGRVGRATARALAERDLDCRIVEMLPERIQDPEKYLLGNAADLEILVEAGIREAPTVIITPHDDEVNVYLTIYCRQLRPDIQILSRATHERNVATLHRAGADIVLSYASMGASAVINLLQRSKILMVAEGLDLFKVRVPSQLAGRPIAMCGIREQTGCSVVAISKEGGMEVVSDPSCALEADADLLLIGTDEAEEQFLELYGKREKSSRRGQKRRTFL